MPERAQSLTVSDARRKLTAALKDAGFESPDADARILIGHALGLDRGGLITQAKRIVSQDETDAITVLAARRLKHEPVARIVGHKEFWGLDLRLSPATLVPRPETETIVEAALAAIDQKQLRTHPLRVADLGTGTGAILLALLSELPEATGIGTDINADALTMARDNARDLGLAHRGEFVLSDFGAALTERFDLVVSNPPYIATHEISDLALEVKEHDPLLALDGGTDGLDCYRRIAGDAQRLLVPGGLLVLEIGAGQSAAVAALLEAAGLRPAAPPRDDLAGIPRALIFQGFS